MKKFTDKLDKYELVLTSLNNMIDFSDTMETPIEQMNEAVRDSIIKKFEYTFELAWKTLKEYFEIEGY